MDLTNVSNQRRWTIVGLLFTASLINYLERAAYDVRKQHISVFVFQERSLRLRGRLKENSFAPTNVSFNMETWSQDGLRYFVIGDASAADIDSLAKLFKADV